MYGISTRICHQKSTIHVGTYTHPIWMVMGLAVTEANLRRCQARMWHNSSPRSPSLGTFGVLRRSFFGWAKTTWKKNDCNKKSRLDLTVVTFSNDALDGTNMQFQKGLLTFIWQPCQFTNYLKLLQLELLTPAFRKETCRRYASDLSPNAAWWDGSIYVNPFPHQNVAMFFTFHVGKESSEHIWGNFEEGNPWFSNLTSFNLLKLCFGYSWSILK